MPSARIPLRVFPASPFRRAVRPGLLSLALTTLAGCSPATPAGKPLDLSNWQITFEDQFQQPDISALGPINDQYRWIAHTPWNGDFGDAAFGNPGPDGPFKTTNDGLTITASKDEHGKWRSGLISSMDKDGEGQHGFAQQYGYFEMNAKLPDGPGVWPAFWLIGVDKSKAASEIDVVEYYGVSNKYFHSVEHIWKQGADSRSVEKMSEVPPGLLSRGFNTYGVLIGPERTEFYLNREEIWSTPTPEEYKQPFYMLANLALGGGWPIDKLQSPQVMTIRYIRAYKSKS